MLFFLFFLKVLDIRVKQNKNPGGEEATFRNCRAGWKPIFTKEPRAGNGLKALPLTNVQLFSTCWGVTWAIIMSVKDESFPRAQGVLSKPKSSFCPSPVASCLEVTFSIDRACKTAGS